LALALGFNSLLTSLHLSGGSQSEEENVRGQMSGSWCEVGAFHQLPSTQRRWIDGLTAVSVSVGRLRSVDHTRRRRDSRTTSPDCRERRS